MSGNRRFTRDQVVDLLFDVPGDGEESDDPDFSGDEGGFSEESSPENAQSSGESSDENDKENHVPVPVNMPSRGRVWLRDL